MDYRPRFLKPGELTFGIDAERKDSSETDPVPVFKSSSQFRDQLPICKVRNNILYLVEKFQTVIIVGETGCGKSTQVPQFLLEAGWANHEMKIGVTQPRRIAATTLANRVAEERNTLLGQEVGYSIRFDDCCNPKLTRIKFLTEGTLINEMMSDPLLTRYSVLMLDEIHERNLNQDILMGLLKKIMKKRPDLKIVVSSATFDAVDIQQFFNFNVTDESSKDTAAIMSVVGRNYPVDIYYSYEPVANYVKAAVEMCIEIHKHESPGHILVFLTGQEEVEQAFSLLLEYAKQMKNEKNVRKLTICPLYGSLPMADQLKVFHRVDPLTMRKIVVATNIAEASITISGIAYVIDCGFVKLKYFNPRSSTDSLVVVPISQASAVQRAGRAGRTKHGKVYRLFKEEEYSKLAPYTIPEMQRSNLAAVILQLKALGIENILRFNFLSAPPSKHVIGALELLCALGALDEDGALTDPLGAQMAEFLLNPMFSKMLLISRDFGCTDEALTIAAMLQVQNVFVHPAGKRNDARKAKREFSVEEGDFITLLNVHNSFVENGKRKKWCEANYLNYKNLVRATEIKSQLSKLLARFKVPTAPVRGDDMESLLKCIVSAFFSNAAYLHYTGVYKTVRGDHTLHIHPESVVAYIKQPQWVVFNEVLHTTKEYMQDITVIKPSWLYELAPHYYQYGTDRQVEASS